MIQAAHLRDQQTSVPSPSPTGGQGRPRTVRRLRLDRTLGFWLGGFVFGTAGCVIGFCFPYHHPVAVTVSVLWWGFYFGWLGASVGAGIGLLAERAPASPPKGPAAPGQPCSKAEGPADHSGSFSGASWVGIGVRPSSTLPPKGCAQPMESAGER